MTTQDTEATYAGTTSAELVKTLREVVTQPPSRARAASRHALITELKRRHPETEAVIQAAYDAVPIGGNIDYVAVLTGAIKP